jgi:hypothetical protein
VIIPDLQIDLFFGQAALIEQLDFIDVPADAAVWNHFDILSISFLGE